MTDFLLHPQLAADTVAVAELELSSLRLMNCRALPWLVLVPRAAGMREIIDLPEAAQVQLLREISRTSLLLKKLFNPHKLNVAALGNVVPQLHVHVIARFEADAAWPKPVWGNISIEPYETAEQNNIIRKIQIELEKSASPPR